MGLIELVINGLLGMVGPNTIWLLGLIVLIILIAYAAMNTTPGIVSILFIGSVLMWLAAPASQGGVGIFPDVVYFLMALIISVVLFFGVIKVFRRSG